MQHPFKIILLATIVASTSCNNSLTDAATNWTTETKRNIIKEASQPHDEMVLDTGRGELIFLKEGKKLKYYMLWPSFDQTQRITSFDTAVSIFYSADQRFELVKELCPIADRSFEGVRYNGYWVGRLEYRYCNGKPKNIYFCYTETVGIEKEYDSTGRLIKETDHGKTEKLENLIEIKY